MKHYIDSKTNELYAYEADGSQDKFIKNGLIQISDDEAQKIQKAPTNSDIQKFKIMAELSRIDAASTRPARAVGYAIASGNQPDPADVAQLGALEAQAQSLRAELKALA